MSNGTAKMKKPVVKVTPSSRFSVNPKMPSIYQSGAPVKHNQSIMNRSVTGSSSRRSVVLQADSKLLDKGSLQTGKQAIQVFDEQGNDVTPLPLFHPDPNAPPPKQSNFFASQDASMITAPDFLSTISMYQTGMNTSFAGPFTRSIIGSSTVSKSSRSTVESMNEEIEEPGTKRVISLSLSDVQIRREEVKDIVTEDMLDKTVDVYLTETETLWILDMPATMISTDAEEAETVKLRTQAYVELCKNRLGNDLYVDRMMQTLNDAPKCKEVQCEKIIRAEAATMATIWDMYDTFLAEEASKEDNKTTKVTQPSRILSRPEESKGTDAMSIISSASISSLSSLGVDAESIISGLTKEEPSDPELILKSESFQQNLCVMERIIMENIFQPKLADYRQLHILKDPDCKPPEEDGIEEEPTEVTATTTPTLDRLWSFSCEVTKGHNVSSMAWNKINKDLLAVGYGEFDFRDQKGGLVCCWSLKNPMWPERVYHCESGVTSLDFSIGNPNLLAVGMHNGEIVIFNVQRQEDTPLIDSSNCFNKHTGPVWQLQWIEQERGASGDDKGDSLISVSADGKIAKWYLRKGLDCTDLMKLKRTRGDKSKKPTGEKERKIEALISRQAPGMCFDFHPKDANIYLVGTEEGHIHKCSCSYNEQFLDTYKAHRSPVYKIAWSPFSPDVFLSCSADWTIRLWQQDLLKPVLNFSSVNRAIYEIMWSPKSPMIFGAVNEERVEIWDLDNSILDPTIVSSASPGVTLTTILFAESTDCVLIGDSDGQVTVYKMKHLTSGITTQANALDDLIGSTLASQL
ncbi:dynein axonemal intermediate chain 4 [Erpetoichthys calabaricus]|uniref:Dynein axonemal intermediate chain 4 n=1 Tax=Erpetoichthys calabaricus TaxID=27687 RepID=A0A8C4SB56_ERPCA|nr:dynein axonemal intermediate chain 4 [Erpetoichthys calabaricus]